MSKLRIYVHPGYVRSISDGDLHYLNFYELCGLYGKDPRKVRLWKEGAMQGYREQEGDRHLYPREDGKYDE